MFADWLPGLLSVLKSSFLASHLVLGSGQNLFLPLLRKNWAMWLFPHCIKESCVATYSPTEKIVERLILLQELDPLNDAPHDNVGCT